MLARRRSFRLIGVFSIVLLALGSASAATAARQWSLGNQLACDHPTPPTTCGPLQQMYQDAGNGVFPTGLITVKDHDFRIWVSDRAVAAVDFGRRSWTLALGGTATISRLTWTVGSWNWATGAFTPAPGAETIVTAGGQSTFRPSSVFRVPGNQLPALRLSGASRNGTASVIDVYDERGSTSPSFVRVAAAQ